MGISIYAGYGGDERTWSYSYGTFANLREAIAEALGVDRAEYWGPRFNNYTLLGYWVNPDEEAHVDTPFEVVEDDIDYLMLHQDCEGILPYWAALRTGVRLKEVVEIMPAPPLFGFNARGLAFELADLLEWAGENGYMVRFS